MRNSSPRRLLAAAVLALATTVAATTATVAPASAADGDIALSWKVDATTTLKNLNQTVVVPTGTFTGNVNFWSGELTGDMQLPQARKRLDIGALPLATVTFAMEQAAPVSGRVDFSDMSNIRATTNATFNVRIVSIRPVLTPWVNLVGNSCRTVSPVTTTLNGPINLNGANTFTGSYTMPRFTGCGLFATNAINLVVPGPGNTMTATFSS